MTITGERRQAFPTDRPFRIAEFRPSTAERRELRGRVRDGTLRTVFRGVFVDAAIDLTVEVRSAATALVLPPGAAIARRTAAWIHGVDARMPGEQHDAVPLECVVPPGTEPVSYRGVRCYSAPLRDSDLALVNGVPCTTPVRTALDLLRWLPPHMGLGAADAFAHRGLVAPGELVAELDRFAGHRGVAQARRLSGFVEPLCESFGESWARLRLLDAGFPAPVVQVPVVDGSGRVVYRLDLGWPQRRLAAEYDGVEFHSSPQQRRHDHVRRHRLAREFGWHVVPLTMAEVLGPSMHLERGFGELLGCAPAIARRLW